MSLYRPNCVMKLVLTLVMLVASMQGVGAEPPGKGRPQVSRHDHVPDELLVKFRGGVTPTQAQAAVQTHGVREARKFKAPRKLASAAVGRWWHMKLAPGQNAKRVLERLARDPLVEAVELNYVVRTTVVPNDPRYAELWGLNNIGQTGGITDADIDAPEAWDVHTGSPAVSVAVIDTGVDYIHPDLAANIWTNPGEIPGNGIDDDANGYVDDVYGYDFANNDPNPLDDHGHGTHVAGTIAAVGNNGVGVVGVSWQARVMAVKFLGADGSGSTSGAISAVLYAADMGARVMNNSWGGGGFSQALHDAIVAANNAGALFVAAAGNSDTNNDTSPHYPSSYDVPNVLAIAATDASDAKASFSSYGATSVDLGAPGVSILSSVPSAGASCCSDPTGYKLLSGTSMATPHVAGAATLLLAQDPSRSGLGIKNLLMATGDSLPSLTGITVSGARLNLQRAMTCSPTQLALSIEQPAANFNAYQNQPQALRVLAHSCGQPVSAAQVTATFSNGDASLQLFDDGLHGDGAANDGMYGNTWTPVALGVVNLTIAATHGSLGSISKSVSGQVRQRFSYRADPTTYLWNEITDGTRHSLSDDSSVTIPIGFDFTFFGVTYSSVAVSSNGFLTFRSQGTTELSNVAIPNTSPPNALLAAFWDDLLPSGGGVYSKLEGTAPNRRLTVAWVNVSHYHLGGNGTVSFQVILREGSDDVVLQYQDVVFGSAGYDYGASATVGVEGDDGIDGTQYSHLQARLSDASALRFYPGPYNRVPVALAGGPYQSYVNLPVTFNGAGSYDPEGQPLTYRWNFGDGTSGTGAAPSHAYAAKGTYTVTLVVNDGYLDSAPVTTTVTIPNRAPVANAGGPYSGQFGTLIGFNGSASSDPDGDPLLYRWSFGDGTSATGVSPTHAYSTRGTYTATLIVNDGSVDSVAASATVMVTSPIPVANAGADQKVHARSSVTLDGSRSYDDDGTIVNYAWRQISGKGVKLSNASSAIATFTAPPHNAACMIGALLEFELTVIDNTGNTATDRVFVTVYDRSCPL